MFLATGFGQFAYQNYATVWNLPAQGEDVLSLMPPPVMGMIKFFDLIRSRNGSKIFLSEMLEAGIDADTFYTLIMLVISKQSTQALQCFPNDGDPYILYFGISKTVNG